MLLRRRCQARHITLPHGTRRHARELGARLRAGVYDLLTSALVWARGDTGTCGNYLKHSDLCYCLAYGCGECCQVLPHRDMRWTLCMAAYLQGPPTAPASVFQGVPEVPLRSHSH